MNLVMPPHRAKYSSIGWRQQAWRLALAGACLCGLSSQSDHAWAVAPEEEIHHSAPVPGALTPIKTKRPRTEVDPRLSRAYNNLQAGRLETARRDYEEALRGDPKNIDVRLGLAAIAQSQGRTAESQWHFRQALEADPRNAFARAASLSLSAFADPIMTESRLKSWLASEPESPPLNFCLGNLYAHQHRWAEAQQRYFNTVAAAGDNPDYLFNLAVSLDHLREARAAARYYRLALEAGERQPATFNRQQAGRRLHELDIWIGETPP